MSKETIIKSATLYDNAARYHHYLGLLIFLGSVGGIVLMPFFSAVYLIWVAPHYKKYYTIDLTEDRVKVRRGVINRSEYNVPLDRITDISTSQDLLMRMMSIKAIKIETAGGQANATGGVGIIVGVSNAEELREAILEQRKKLISSGAGVITTPTPSTEVTKTIKEEKDILAEIKEVLLRIEKKS